MRKNNPYRAINFPGGTVFERPFPVDSRTEAISHELSQLEAAVQSGLTLRGAASHFETLRPGISTHPAMGEITVASSTRDEIIDFHMRQLTRRDLAKAGMTLAVLTFNAEGPTVTDFSISGINGLNPHAGYVDVDGYLDDDGEMNATAIQHDSRGRMLETTELGLSAARDFIRSIRDFSSTPDPLSDSIDDEIFALFAGADNRMVTHSGRYVFEEDNIEIFADHSTLYRESKPPMVNYSFEVQETKENDTMDSKRSYRFSVKKGNTKTERPTYQARFGMSIQDKRTPDERAASYEQTSMYFLDNPKEFYTSIGRVAALFANPFQRP